MAAKKRTAKKSKKPVAKRLTSLTIDRRKWGKGALVTNAGKMCCLGFACKKLGAKVADMRPKQEELAYPIDVTAQRPELTDGWPRWLFEADAYDAAVSNDGLTGRRREKKVKEVFARNGCAVRFTH